MAPSAGLVLEKGHQSFWPIAWLWLTRDRKLPGARDRIVERPQFLKTFVGPNASLVLWKERVVLSTKQSTVQLPRDSLDVSWNHDQKGANWMSINIYNGKIRGLFDFYLECATQKVNVKSLIYGVPWTSATAQAQRSNAGNYYAMLLSMATLENFTDSETRPVKFGCAK